MTDRWEPAPVPLGDGRHDIGDDVRAAIVERLTSDWSRDPDLTPEKARQLAMWAGVSVRALFHELGTLRDFAGDAPRAAAPAELPWKDSRGYVLPQYVAVVEREGGGVQLEGHTKEQDWELEIDQDGYVEAFWCKPKVREAGSVSSPYDAGKESAR